MSAQGDDPALPKRRRALIAATLGYGLDAMDVLFYVFALQMLRAEFALTNAEAGLVSSLTLITSAAGGIATGILSDRFGRKRLLMGTILVYSLASAGSATAHSFAELLFWRGIVGLGLGGEWSAGATMIAETWPAAGRQKAIGIMQSGWAGGYMLAAVLSGLILPRFGWRVLFLIGLLPAALTLYVRYGVSEPETWLRNRTRGRPSEIFRGPLLQTTVRATMLASVTLLGYWGLFTWLPGFLSAPVSAGGAGINLSGTSAYVFIVQAGALAGYLSFGTLAERFGRKRVFTAYVITAAALVPLYGMVPALGLANLLIWLGPLLGFAGTGYFALFGAMLAELYPTAVRGSGQGFTYNFGRLICAGAPWGTGFLADSWGIGAALALNSAFFLAAALLIRHFPEVAPRELPN